MRKTLIEGKPASGRIAVYPPMHRSEQAETKTAPLSERGRKQLANLKTPNRPYETLAFVRASRKPRLRISRNIGE